MAFKKRTDTSKWPKQTKRQRNRDTRVMLQFEPLTQAGRRRAALLARLAEVVRANTYHYFDLDVIEVKLAKLFAPTEGMSELERIHLASMHRSAVERASKRAARRAGVANKFYPPGLQGERERSQRQRKLAYWQQSREARP